MVDIHSHIFWGMDDGSQSKQDSLEMLEMAAAAGTTDIVGTPHADQEYAFRPELIAERAAELQEAMGDRIKIHTGCDFHLKLDNIRDALENPRKYTVNGKGWLLVEFSDMMIFPNTEQIFSQFAEAGMRVIVTHPERNWLLRKDIDRLANWVMKGAYLQATGQSLEGVFGPEARKFSEELMERGLVHFLASDAHDKQRRTTRLDGTRKLVTERYGEDLAEALLERHPRAVVDGMLLDVGPLPPPERKRKWYQFWR